MKRHLAGALLMAGALTLAGSMGCASRAPQSNAVLSGTQGSVLYGTFVETGKAQLDASRPLQRLIAAGDAVYAYTDSNQVYGLSDGLEIRFVKQVLPQFDGLGSVVQVGEELIFPSPKKLLVLDKQGTQLRQIPMTHPITSDIRVDARGLLLAGTASPTGGRVSVLDPNRRNGVPVQDTLIGNVLSAPVSLQGIVFAATDKGKVYAIAGENRAVWPLEGMSFDTDRPIVANLAVDDFALYVASNDGTLYALDRATGRIKWRYMAEVALKETPVVTKDAVYLVVPGKGLVALNKTDGKIYRDPIWVADDVTRVVSVDDQYIYALRGGGTLAALGVKDGQTKFSASGQFDFVTASASGTIFAATKGGSLVSLKRGPYVGEVAAGN